jgi:purine-binding chemotaxis protein CheW
MVELLTLEVAGRHYAIPAACLQEVTRAVAISTLPKAPPIIDGVINVRGTIVPVIDVRQRCGLESRSVTPDQHFVVAHAANRVVALRVDQAIELLAVEESAIESAALVAPGSDYVAGIAKLPDGLIVIHDLDRFLSLEESSSLDAALAATPAALPGWSA